MINPILFNLGSLEIRWYGLLFALGFLIGYFILIKLAPRFNIKKEIIEDYVPLIIIAAVVGARLFKVIVYEPSYYLANPLKIFAVWEGGLASHGAIILMILTTIWFCKRKNINFFKFADLVVIPIALGAGLIRVGNFINGELVGKVTNVPWAINFIGYEGLRHPVQLYQFLGYIIIFIILLSMLKLKNRETGTIFWSFFILATTYRSSTHSFNAPTPHNLYILSLNLAQWISIIIILISICPLHKRIKKFLHKHDEHF